MKAWREVEATAAEKGGAGEGKGVVRKANPGASGRVGAWGRGRTEIEKGRIARARSGDRRYLENVRLRCR